MARRKERNELVAGTFIVLAMALLVAVLLALADWHALFEGHKKVRVVFAGQSIKDLKAGAEVKVRGVTVGKVGEVILDYNAPKTIEVIIKVPHKLKLRANASLSIDTTALGGSAWIEIEDIGSDRGFVVPAGGPLHLPTPCYLATQPDVRHPLAESAVPVADLDHPIYGSEAPNQLVADMSKQMGFGSEQRTQFQEIMLSLNEAAVKVNDSAGKVNDMLAEVQTTMMPKVDKSLANVQNVTGGGIKLMDAMNTRIPGALDHLDAAVAEAYKLLKDQAPVVADAIKKINSTAATLDGGARQQLQNVQAAMEQLRDILAKAQEAMESVRQFTGAARDVMVANRDTVNDTLANVHEGSEHMKAALAEIRREPWRLLHTPSPAEVSGANLMAATRAYAEGASEVLDATNRLTALVNLRGSQLKTDEPDYQKLLADLNKSYQKFNKAQQALYDLLKVK